MKRIVDILVLLPVLVYSCEELEGETDRERK